MTVGDDVNTRRRLLGEKVLPATEQILARLDAVGVLICPRPSRKGGSLTGASQDGLP
jgi:hypothetical protein